jgi:DNA mismatch endonuclease (patch repair protein)
MADVFSPAERSALMGRIRGRGNESTELAMARLLRQHGLSGWRRHRCVTWPSSKMTPTLRALQCNHRLRCSARPDFIFPSRKVALFIDGCFWHSCPLHSTAPATNAAFWHEKLAKNMVRDKFVTAALRKQGWVVLRVWEHELGSPSRMLARVRRALDRTRP